MNNTLDITYTDGTGVVYKNVQNKLNIIGGEFLTFSHRGEGVTTTSYRRMSDINRFDYSEPLADGNTTASPEDNTTSDESSPDN